MPLNYEELVELNLFVNLDDRDLQKIKENNFGKENFTKKLVDKFVEFNK